MDLERIENCICAFLKVNREDVLSGSVKHHVAEARHYIWYILHYHCGLSNLQIARRYGRARVTVIQYITQVKFRITHQREDTMVYDALKKIIQE